MTPERWQQVKVLFTGASEMPAAEQRAYLEGACRGDAALLAEVESLLAAHAKKGAIVDRPAMAHVTDDSSSDGPDPWLGRRIGSYEIVALIGHGGMGDVYRARRVDAHYEKEVAIKLVPGGWHASFVLERFRAERQILADLEHPHIARLIDGGATEDGSPYLVMELVEGVPLDRYAESRHLSVRERLRLLRDVCAAVAYAHQHLVVHRDLKPGNILVTADGDVKLLDFGIAKLLQPATPEAGPELTGTLMQVLTPGYASPEQVLGKPITTASDVYSLGVVLYVLLTRRSPYRGTLDSAEAAIREICDTEPLRPSAVAPVRAERGEPLGRDLDAIVLCALRKEPERRYASVEALSEDIRRYLEGLPVTARGERFSYRAGKLLRRHRIEAGAAALLVLTLVGATVVSLREARIAMEQERLAQAERARAERHFASVRGLANSFLFEVHDAIKDLPGSTAARDLVVSTALEYLNALAAEAGSDTKLRLELAAAYEKVADIQGQAYSASKGQPRAALESYGKAIVLLEPMVAADAHDARARSALGRAYLQQSQLHLLLGDPPKALRRSEQAIAALERLGEMQPDAATRRALAKAYQAHCYTIDMAGKEAGAGFKYASKAVSILEDLAQQSPNDLELVSELSSAYNMAGLAMERNDTLPDALDRALGFYRQALAMDEQLVAATRGENAKYARSMLVGLINIALTSYDAGDYRGAIRHAREALSFLATRPVDPNDGQARLDATNLQWALGRALLAAGELREAASVFQEMTVQLEAIARKDDTLKVQFLLGAAAWGMGSVHLRLASRAGAEDGDRLAEWRLTERWYGTALLHFERVTESVTLPPGDQRLVEEATTGRTRAKAEIEKLQAASAAG